MASLGNRDFADFAAAESVRLTRLGFALTGNPHDAADLAQETLLRVGQAWPRIDVDWAPQAYARKTMYRLHSRRTRRWRERLTDVLLDRQPATAEDVSAVDDRDQLVRLLADLPRRQRAAVVFRYYFQMSESETAEAMSCSVGNVKSQASRGLATLRRRIASPEAVTSSGNRR